MLGSATFYGSVDGVGWVGLMHTTYELVVCNHVSISKKNNVAAFYSAKNKLKKVELVIF